MKKQARVALERDSSKLRKHVCELFGGSEPESVVLAPGILSALQVVFAALDVESLALPTGEYYSKPHFPAQRVIACKPAQLLQTVQDTSPSAVITSLIAWTGDPQDAPALFEEIRNRNGRRPPLLVLDYTHAGAVGFPPMCSLNADIVVGDFAKWVAPANLAKYVAFLWIANPKLRERLVESFRGFFLATRQSTPRAARWLPSWELRQILDYIEDSKLTRKSLLARTSRDLELAKQVASVLGIACPSNSILWTRKLKKHPLISALLKSDLIWNTGNGYRIRCRAELLQG